MYKNKAIHNRIKRLNSQSSEVENTFSGQKLNRIPDWMQIGKHNQGLTEDHNRSWRGGRVRLTLSDADEDRCFLALGLVCETRDQQDRGTLIQDHDDCTVFVLVSYVRLMTWWSALSRCVASCDTAAAADLFAFCSEFSVGWEFGREITGRHELLLEGLNQIERSAGEDCRLKRCHCHCLQCPGLNSAAVQ